MSYSDDERDFREAMEENNTDDEYEFADEQEHYNQEPPNLLEQIATRGRLSAAQNLHQEENINTSIPAEDIIKYGYQNQGQYSMENFIVEILELDMSDELARSMLNWGEAGQLIIDKAVETMNSGSKKEIQFTPQEDTEYKKLKLIYDKLAMELQKMICKHLNIEPCNLNSTNLIAEAVKKYPDIRFEPGMTFGYKLKTIEDYLENKMKSEKNGGRKTRRRRSASKKRSNKRKYNSKSKKRRYARKKKM